MPSPAKTELRRLMRAELARMSPAASAAASESIRTSIASLPRWQEARVVAAFAATNGEPDLKPLDWSGSKIVLLPRVDGETLVFHAVKDFAQLKAGAFGIPEPDPELCAVADPATAQMIFVPGLAFTADGHRLGRGRGYYDHLLATLPSSILRIGVCFPGQMVDSLPTESHDQSVDFVLSSPA